MFSLRRPLARIGTVTLGMSLAAGAVAAVLALVTPVPVFATVGQPIAYTYMRGDWYDVFTSREDGSDTNELTKTGLSRNPSWASDGSRIAFIHSTQHPEIRSPRQIFMMRADGTDKVKLRTWKRDITFIDWAPDPRYLAVAEIDSSTSRRRIIRYDIKTGATRVLYSRTGAGKISDLDWSRDGARIAFTVKNGTDYSTGVLNVATGSVRSSSVPNGANVAWANTSNRLATRVRSSSKRGYMKVVSGDSVKTILAARQLGGASWAPGDGLLVFDGMLNSWDYGLYTMRPDGTGLTKLLGDDRYQYPAFTIRDPEWRPNPTRDAASLAADVAETCDYGGPASLDFELKAEDGSAIEGETVLIQSSSDARSWGTPFDPRVSSATGDVSASGEPTKRRYYRAYFAGDATSGVCVSPFVRVVPRVYLTTPSAPSRIGQDTYFRSSGSIKPRHAEGSYPVRLHCYRYEELSDGSHDWVLRRIANAKASDYDTYSHYAATISLPYAGDWRIRAYHRGDELNATTYSAWRYLTVE